MVLTRTIPLNSIDFLLGVIHKDCEKTALSALHRPAVLHRAVSLKKQRKISCDAAAIYHAWPQKRVVWKQGRKLMVSLAIYFFSVGTVEGSLRCFLLCWSSTENQVVEGALHDLCTFAEILLCTDDLTAIS